MVGIKDIAKLAGVSTATVSYALNGTKKISTETKNRILKIAEELDYRPSLVGRSLQQRKTKLIAFYLVDYGAFYGRVLAGAKRVLEENGYNLIVCSGEHSQGFLPEGLVDGAIIFDHGFPNDLILKYAQRNMKMVVLERNIEHPNIGRVLIDNIHGGGIAMEELVKQGVSKVILITGPKSSYSTDIRREAAEQVAKAAGIEVEVLEGAYSIESGHQHAPYIYAQSQKHTLGVFAFNDNMAIGLYAYFAEIEGFTIGEDIKIVGFDAMLAGQLSSPTLTSVYFSQTQWGEFAAESLLKMLRDNEEGSTRFLETSLLLGTSTDASAPRQNVVRLKALE